MRSDSQKAHLPLKCTYFPACQGCSHWDLSYAEQTEIKTKNLRHLLDQENLKTPEIQFISCGEYGLRHRLDFTIQNDGFQKMGFYDQDKKLININTCLQLAPDLQKFFEDFQKIQFPIKKGSARLRIGPGKIKGCWLDFSNVDIKNLLDEKTTFKKLLSLGAIVEIGQKGKTLTEIGDALKLTDPKPYAWFETYDQNLKPIPLLGLVSDFTQPSWISAKKMVETILGWTKNLNANSKLIEFGPGLGQFTLPLLSKGFNVAAYESNESATTFLKLNAQDNQLIDHLKINLGDYQNKSILDNQQIDFALVNPPRSGLKKFTDELIKTNAESLAYISCFPETMVKDLVYLVKAGYEIKDVKIIDQFPQTSHYESCVLLQKLL